jgi:HD-GYP domain-containing protein (c-di-GMP phosphodiesterase class II)
MGYPSGAKWNALLPVLRPRRVGNRVAVSWPKGTTGQVLGLASGNWLVLGPLDGKKSGADPAIMALIRDMLREGRLVRGALERKGATLDAVLHLGHALANIKDIKHLVASQMVPELVQLLNADRGSVFLIDDERQELYSVIALGVELKEIRMPIDRGLAGWVARTGETLNVPDAHHDDRFNPEFDRRSGYRTKSVLAAPMVDPQGTRIGVVQVINKKGAEAFSRADEELLSAIASEAAVAIINVRLVEEQKAMFESFVTAITTALESRDELTSFHTRRVVEYAVGIGRQLGLPHPMLERIRLASMLHDLGKIHVPDAVLKKPGGLTKEEFEVIKEHAMHTRLIVQKVRLLPELKDLPRDASMHHERVDGSGYPEGLKGEAIPITARVIAVADVFDAITSKRHYREAMPIDQALDIIRQGSGSHFDPKCVDAFLKYFEAELRPRFTPSAQS